MAQLIARSPVPWPRYRMLTSSGISVFLWLALCLVASCVTCNESIRRLEPAAECSMLLYSDVGSEPLRMNDSSGTCPEGGGARAFLLDVKPGSGMHPKLKEASPVKSQKFACQPEKECQVAVVGYGLKSGDRIAVLDEQESCPPRNFDNVKNGDIVLSVRSLTVSSAAVFDTDAKPLSDKSVVTVFSLGTLPPGSYNLCYSPSTALQGVPAAPKDYHYNSGLLTVGPNPVFSCDFENDTCNLINFTDHLLDLKWARHQGSTVTPGTGPSYDHTKGENNDGFYVYMKSPGFVPGATATLLGPPTVYQAGMYCLSLHYHMYGDDVNSLRVYMHNMEDGKDLTGDWGSPLWLRVGDHGDEWQQGGVEFDSDGTTPKVLVLEALAGFSEKGDIGLDDIAVTPGRCPKELLSKKYNKDYICGEVRLVSGNWSEDKSWYLEGAVSCAGRGYSYDQLKGGWVPCCVPTYGKYTVVLRDQFGDGWNGSQVEFRFFDEVMRFGEDFEKKDGGEKKYDLVIGLLQISVVEATEESVHLEVVSMIPNAYIWCGVAQRGAPSPTVDILKKYGVRSPGKSGPAGDKVRILIQNSEGARLLKPNEHYDVYCYAESAEIVLLPEVGDGNRNQLMQMDDSQVRASQIVVTTDNSPPVLSMKIIKEGTSFFDIDVEVQVNEPAIVWCLAVEKENIPESGEAPTVAEIKANGRRMMITKPDVGHGVMMRMSNLLPDSTYVVYGYAEDMSEPAANTISTAEMRNMAQEVSTQGKKPSLKIQSYRAFAKGFAVTVKVDTPSTVWCGAALAGSAYPSREDLRRVGASKKVVDTSKPVELEIRGVPPNTRYTVYCFASSRNGNAEMSESDMWDTALEATSFGKFCDLPADPSGVEEGKATPFDPLTHAEDFLVREYMTSQRDLGLDGVYRVNLLPDKEAIIQHFDHNGPFPKRYARVRVGRCRSGQGSYEQYRVGPLDSGSRRDLTYTLIGTPVLTDCGGYTPQGVFGRRLLDMSHREELSDVLQESFNYGFGVGKCSFEGAPNCLSFGPVVYERSAPNVQNDNPQMWVGLRTPEGDVVSFFFILEASDVDMTNPKDPNVRHHLTYDLKDVIGLWYNGQRFDSVEHFLERYYSGDVKKVTPEILEQRKVEETMRESEARRLAPTSTLPGPNPRGRGGLEYRVAPEHIEPQGRRFTASRSPGGDSFSISYNGWEMTVNNDRDTSLRLWNVKFNGLRVAFEMGLMEAVAHYSVAERNFYFLDSWYGGLGSAARKLHPGIECPTTGVLAFFDESLCIFEQDQGRPIRSHWKTGELRDGAPHHSLILRQMLTVSNYDYVTDYVFHISGSFEGSVSFTGELYAGVEIPWYSARQGHFGTQVTGSMRMGALHNHMAVWKIDIDVLDANKNSVMFKEVVPDPIRRGAHKVEKWIADVETEAAWRFNGTRALHYFVVNEDHKVYGNVGGYLIKPRSGIAIQQEEFELYSGPASWTKYKVLSAVRKESELDATLPRDNKYASRPAVDIDRYIEDNESLRNKDVVSWISDGIWHLPLVEDMPLTLCLGNTLGWLVKPANFFREDPSMDMHNAVAGDVQDPGTCAMVRSELKRH